MYTSTKSCVRGIMLQWKVLSLNPVMKADQGPPKIRQEEVLQYYTICRRNLLPPSPRAGGRRSRRRLEALKGLAEAGPLRPVTPINVHFWTNAVSTQVALDALQAMGPDGYARRTDSDDLSEPGDDITISKRLRKVSTARVPYTDTANRLTRSSPRQ